MIEAVAVGCLVVALWCWGVGLRAIFRGTRSRSWPTVTGVIRALEVVRKKNSRGIEVCRYVLEYSYTVNGRQHSGSRFRFGIPNALSWVNPSSPQFRPLRRGDRVLVFHSPFRPSVSALEPGVSPFVLITIVAGAVIARVGIRLFSLPGWDSAKT